MRNIKTMLLRFWDWLKVSSADPTKISLTLKSAGPLILAVAAWFKLDLGTGDWDKVIEAIVGIVSGFYFLFGLGRKVVLSFK